MGGFPQVTSVWRWERGSSVGTAGCCRVLGTELLRAASPTTAWGWGWGPKPARGSLAIHHTGHLLDKVVLAMGFERGGLGQENVLGARGRQMGKQGPRAGEPTAR